MKDTVKKILVSSVYSVLGRIFFQIIYLFQIKFGLDILDSNDLIRTFVPAIGFGYFSKSGINAIIVKIKDLDSFYGARALNDIIFVSLYIPYTYVVGYKLEFFSFVLSYFIYHMLIQADKFLFFGSKYKYIVYNNLLYVFLTLFVLLHVHIKNIISIDNKIIYLFLAIIFIISIKKIYVEKETIKNLIIVQSGNIVSTILGVIHAGRLSGLSLTNFTFGKSIGEFPNNFLGYHISNFIHKNGLNSYQNDIKKWCSIILAFYLIMFSVLILFDFNILLNISEKLLVIISLFLLLFPLQIVNTVLTRQLQKNSLFLEGTIIQIISNTSALSALFIFGFNPINIFLVYYFTFLFGSVSSLILLYYFNYKPRINS